jgi:glycosyltransferase involved in cell wall biosynthesis
MTDSKSFGVIIPAYQSARYIAEALESIFAQTCLPREVLISDDGSNDGTSELILSIALNAPIKVRLIANQTPAGITNNYLNALRFLDPCDYVAVADHDDIWLPERLQAFLDAFESYNSPSLVCCDSLLGDSNLNPIGQTIRGGREKSRQICVKHERMGSFRSFLKGRLPCLAHTLAFPYSLRNILLSKPNSISNWYFEEWVTSVAACHGEIVLLPEPLTIYRRHASQVTWAQGDRKPKPSLSRNFDSSLLPFSENRLQKLLFCRELLQALSINSNHTEYSSNASSKLIQLQKCISFLQARLKIYKHSTPFSLKITHAITLLFSGSYHRYSSGLRSFTKDIIYTFSCLPPVKSIRNKK